MKRCATVLGACVLALGMHAQAVRTTSVAEASWLTALSTSPAGHGVAAFGMNSRGEAVLGIPLRVNSDRDSKVVILRGRRAVNPETIAWAPATQNIFLGLEDGVFEWNSNGRLRSLWKGLNAGIAVSDAGDRIAFWNLGGPKWDGRFDLIVLDVVKTSVVRRWSVKTLFDRDLNSFDIAFSGDGSVVYARTFDAEDDRPLEAFDIVTGTATRIVDNSSGLSASADGVFFLQREGDSYALQRIVGKVEYRLRDRSFPSARVVGNRKGHHLVTPKPLAGGVWLYDTVSNTKRFIPTTCGAAAVFADGSLLFVNSNRLFWESCNAE